MNPTIASITARGLLGRKRIWLLIPLPLVLLATVTLGRMSGVDPREWGAGVLIGLGFAAVVPLIALIVGTGVLGSEIDDGTVTHLLVKPLPRAEIVFTKLAVAIGVTLLVTVPAMFVAGVVADSTRLGIGLAAGTALASVAYCALFVALSLVTSRPMLLGLLYVLLWEGLLTNLLTGTRVLSIQQYAVTVADRVAGTEILAGQVSLPVSVVMAVLFTVGGTALAVQRLRSFTVAGETG
jgi:ABC-2 type transport system permease protein